MSLEIANRDKLILFNTQFQLAKSNVNENAYFPERRICDQQTFKIGAITTKKALNYNLLLNPG